MDLCGDIDKDPKGRASWKAQKVVRATRGVLGELFKYFTKLMTKMPPRHQGDDGRVITPLGALDLIFRSMKNRRVYQPMGFKRAKDDDDDDEIELTESSRVTNRRAGIVWRWHQQLGDWIDSETGDCLTDYEPGARFRRFVESIR
jgi:hypothetical protein